MEALLLSKTEQGSTIFYRLGMDAGTNHVAAITQIPPPPLVASVFSWPTYPFNRSTEQVVGYPSTYRS